MHANRVGLFTKMQCLFQMQREQEAERIMKMRKNWEAKQDSQALMALQMEKRKIKRTEKVIEQKLLQQHDEALKKMEEDLKKNKLQDELRQKEFLRVSEN